MSMCHDILNQFIVKKKNLKNCFRVNDVITKE